MVGRYYETMREANKSIKRLTDMGFELVDKERLPDGWILVTFIPPKQSLFGTGK